MLSEDMFSDFRERKGEKETEKHLSVTSRMCPNRESNRNLGMCPDRKWTRDLLVCRTMLQPSHQARANW